MYCLIFTTLSNCDIAFSHKNKREKIPLGKMHGSESMYKDSLKTLFFDDILPMNYLS